MITLTLPWPAKELSPNARVHWATKSKAAKKFRRECGQLTMSKVPGNCGGDVYMIAKKLSVSMVFHAPDRRHRDLDNLIASMKSGLDGIADGLYVNDSKFTLAAEIGEPAERPHVSVVVMISA